MKSTSIKRAVAAGVGAVFLAGGLVTPASAFSSGDKLSSGGVTYQVKATSCWLYLQNCSWNTSASVTKTLRFTHYSDVKVNSVTGSVTISANPSATIRNNATRLVTASRTVTAKSNAMNGTAKVSIASVSVAARSRMTAPGVTMNSGWTTW